MRANSVAARRVMLAGESAHVLPPIGAQGLNLSLRDVGALADCLADAAARGDDPGSEPVLESYRSARALDTTTRMNAVDALNRSLLSDIFPVQLARSIGLHAVHALGPLRRQIINAGLNPPGPLPRLMRPGTG